MKQLIFMLSILFTCILSSCGGFTSEVKPLMGNENLSTFTQLAEDGQTVLTGVSNPQSGHVIVAPKNFISVVGDQHVIICRSPEDRFYVYKTTGEHLGVFDLFTHWADGGNYYLGSKYGLQVFYFPEDNSVIESNLTFHEIDVVLLLIDGKWQIRDYYGRLLWTIPDKFTLIRDLDRQDVFVIAIEQGRSCALFDKNGQKLKTLSAKNWKKLQAKFSDVEKTEHNATAANVETLAPYL